MQDEGAGDAQGAAANSAQQQWRACTGMCIVLLLKKFLIQAYHIKEGMLQAYNPEGKKYVPSEALLYHSQY